MHHPPSADQLLDNAAYVACLAQNSLTPLNAVPTSGIVSVLGCVLSFSEPRRTSGRQQHYCMRIRLVDPTILADNRSITYMVFDALDALPQITHTGDVIWLTNVKCQPYNGYPQLLKNHSTAYRITRHDESLDDDGCHPLIRYLRAACSGRVGGQPMTPSAIASPPASSTIALPPVSSSSAYYRLVADMHPGQYADVSVEVLAIQPPRTDALNNTLSLRCLVTDYSENPNLPCDLFASVPGHRVIPCDFSYPDDIPKMPELSVGCALWLRNCQMLADPEWGVRLSVTKDAKYPRTLVVKPLTPDMHGVGEFIARKRDCPGGEADASDAAIDAADVVADNGDDNDAVAEDLPAVTRLSDVCASSKVNVRYRVRATVTRTYPSAANDALIGDECRAILELSDTPSDGGDSAKCLAFFLATKPQSLFKLLHMPADSVDMDEARRRIGRILATPQKVDLVVGACLVPGPQDIPTRCLLIEKFISPI
ncbi:hypothetical protein GGI15_001882 [Coemansia interrupta]|uniref:Telomeric single stranded DNA binding POT1/Cdc13 domain-containing protein n=1 Tax=Coemansia interrupta TaxID=1126814 RepID=A0A9W8HMN5_9FUNG|nr:hypothetical protein GGI15_001882 [Coemansia interrupta]